MTERDAPMTTLETTMLLAAQRRYHDLLICIPADEAEDRIVAWLQDQTDTVVHAFRTGVRT